MGNIGDKDCVKIKCKICYYTVKMNKKCPTLTLEEIKFIKTKPKKICFKCSKLNKNEQLDLKYQNDKEFSRRKYLYMQNSGVRFSGILYRYG